MLISKPTGLALLAVLCTVTTPLEAANQLVSTRDPAQPAPAGGNGDSGMPILSPDGRFVLFGSTADNLLPPGEGRTSFTTVWNVYLRDRLNGTTKLVSVSTNRAEGGNGDSVPMDLSDDGRYALFESRATSLIEGDTNRATDLFLRDVTEGRTLLVSAPVSGLIADGPSHSAVMTPDARYVAFVSQARNLVAEDTNGLEDVFLRDMPAGVTRAVSPMASMTNSYWGFRGSGGPVITPDGRYVAFFSTTRGPPLVYQAMHVRDMTLEVAHHASAAASNIVFEVSGSSNTVCFNPVLSADGRYVAYEAVPMPPVWWDDSLIWTLPDSWYQGVVLRYDLQTGVSDVIYTNAAKPAGPLEETQCLDISADGSRVVFVANEFGSRGNTTSIRLWNAQDRTVSVVSVSLANTVVTNAFCDWPRMDPSGRFVAFLSSAVGLTTNQLSGECHLYLRDMQEETTQLVDAGTNGIGSEVSAGTVPQLSADARLIAFEAPDGTLFPGDDNRQLDVVVRDVTTGSIELISRHDPGLPSSTPNSSSLLGRFSASADGRFVVYASDSDNLTAGDTNLCRDIFLRDLAGATNQLVSAGMDGFSQFGGSFDPWLSADGRWVAFTSHATNLTSSADTNQATDVFVRDLRTGETSLASVNRDDTGPANNESHSPVLSRDGRFLLFQSKATDLAPGSFLATNNLFLRDLVARTNRALTGYGVTSAAMARDARYVAFTGRPRVDTSANVYVWDTQAAALVYTNPLTAMSFSTVSISPDGARLAWGAGLQLKGCERGSNAVWTIADLSTPLKQAPRFSADNRWMTYSREANFMHQVFLYDFAARTETLVSHAVSGDSAGVGRSDWPDISFDGRFVAYRSRATNLMDGDTNGMPDIYLYDRTTGRNALVSGGMSGGPANDRSLTPQFAADGQSLLFVSLASDLVVGDLNRAPDLVSRPVMMAVILPHPGAERWLSWPFVPGSDYRVQFKDQLTDPDWQDLTATFTNLANKAYLQDPSPPATQRFYRISTSEL